jgi:hypothetical protein
MELNGLEMLALLLCSCLFGTILGVFNSVNFPHIAHLFLD